MPRRTYLHFLIDAIRALVVKRRCPSRRAELIMCAMMAVTARDQPAPRSAWTSSMRLRRRRPTLMLEVRSRTNASRVPRRDTACCLWRKILPRKSVFVSRAEISAAQLVVLRQVLAKGRRMESTISLHFFIRSLKLLAVTREPFSFTPVRRVCTVRETRKEIMHAKVVPFIFAFVVAPLRHTRRSPSCARRRKKT